MTDVRSIAETMATEFVRTVEAAAKLQETVVDDLRRQIAEANADRLEGLSKVRKMREEAARIVADSLKVEEQTEAVFRERSRHISDQLNELRMMKAKGPVMIGAAA